MLSPLSRDDVFISYSRKDGSPYAAGIADELTARNLSCFIDKLGTQPDHDLPESLKKKIRNCSLLVVIATEMAAASKFVAKEISEFKKTDRIILLIDFEGAAGRAVWYPLVPGLAAESERNPDSLDTGHPSTNVLNFIEKSFRYSRRNQRMRRWFLGALSTFLTLSIASAALLIFARKQGTRAIAATATANRKTIEANDASRLAAEKTAEALIALGTVMQKQVEAQVATALAKIKEDEAKAAAKLADEKTRLAHQQQLIASSVQDASRAMSRLSADPQASLKTARKALKTARTDEAEIAVLESTFASDGRFIREDRLDPLFAGAVDRSGLYAATIAKDKVCVWTIGTELRKCTQIAAGTDQNPTSWSSIAFSPDGRYVALVDASVWSRGLVWGWQTGKPNPLELTPAEKDEGQKVCGTLCHLMSFVSFSRDGEHLVTGGEDGVVRVWESSTGRELRSQKPESYGKGSSPEGSVEDAQFSPDGRYVLVVRPGLLLWDWASEQHVGVPSNPRMIFSQPSSLVRFGGPKGEYVLTVQKQNKNAGYLAPEEGDRVFVSHFDRLDLVVELAGHIGRVLDAEFSPDGKYIVTAGTDNTARVWDWTSEENLKYSAVLRGHTGQIYSATFSPKGDFVVTASSDNTIRFWKPETNQAFGRAWKQPFDVTPFATLRGHTGDVLGASFNADGNQIISFSSDHTMRVWKTPGEHVLREWKDIQSAGLSPDGYLVATVDNNDVVNVRDLRLPESHAALAALKINRPTTRAHPVFSEDSEWIAIVTTEGIRLWKWKTDPAESLLLPTDQKMIQSVAFSHDSRSRYLISASGLNGDFADSQVLIWDRAEPNKAPLRLSGHKNGVVGAEFSFDNKHVVTASFDNTVRVWDWRNKADKRQLWVLNNITGANFSSAQFSPDGQYIVAAGGAPNVALLWSWRTEPGRRDPILLSGHNQPVLNAVFSDDGRLILTTSFDGTERLWNGRTGASIGVFAGHEHHADFAMFGPRARLVLTADGFSARVYSCDKCNEVVASLGRTR